MATVLVVEDNADLRDMYSEILAMGGHASQLTETVSEALAALAAALPTVVLLDLGVAGDLAALRAALGAADRSGVRIILASGARDLPERAAALGAAAYLLKPFTPEQLLAAVDTVLASPHAVRA
jgi:DNA-binding response OmpR family regulator